MPQATADNQVFYPESDDLFVKNMILGVEIIGGCCGTTPSTIRHMHSAIQSLRTT
ncbi:MAG: homocysteine S-methyltransferase family protein [Desulfotignum sp.]